MSKSDIVKADFTTGYAVTYAINGLTRLEKEAHFAGWEQDFLDTGYGVKVIEALRDKVTMLEQGRKGLDADFGGLEQEVREGRKTITQLQTLGEKADTELENLRLKLKEELELKEDDQKSLAYLRKELDSVDAEATSLRDMVNKNTTELKQARETITQLQSVGERAEELRKENYRLASELNDMKEKLSLKDRKIEKLLDIADNLAQVMDKVTAH